MLNHLTLSVSQRLLSTGFPEIILGILQAEQCKNCNSICKLPVHWIFCCLENIEQYKCIPSIKPLYPISFCSVCLNTTHPSSHQFVKYEQEPLPALWPEYYGFICFISQEETVCTTLSLYPTFQFIYFKNIDIKNFFSRICLYIPQNLSTGLFTCFHKKFPWHF